MKVTLLNIRENGLSVIVKGIHTERVFIDKFIEVTPDREEDYNEAGI